MKIDDEWKVLCWNGSPLQSISRLFRRMNSFFFFCIPPPGAAGLPNGLRHAVPCREKINCEYFILAASTGPGFQLGLSWATRVIPCHFPRFSQHTQHSPSGHSAVGCSRRLYGIAHNPTTPVTSIIPGIPCSDLVLVRVRRSRFSLPPVLTWRVASSAR